MSLSLLQGYSSEEDGAEFEEYERAIEREDVDEEDERRNRGEERGRTKSIFDHPKYPSSSGNLLPSAFEVFSEIAGPPEFLNKSAVEVEATKNSNAREGERKWRGRGGGGGKSGRDKKDLPAGVVVEAKAQLTGIRDRVRSDVEGRAPPPNSESATKTSKEGARVVTAMNPEPSDAAELLRMCVQCGIPKTYSHSKGMVCPVCSDRPLADPNSIQEKKKGSTIKDKEKSKRMKGQSSHVAWKSETEMHLRQQFD